jgi:TatD DNase family protein
MFIDLHTHHEESFRDGQLNIVSLYEHYERCRYIPAASIGIHPRFPTDATRKLEEIEMLAKLPNVLAIGECGLDKLCQTDWNTQVSLFEAQIAIALHNHKPIILHCVRAYEEIQAILSKTVLQTPVIFHGFNKSAELASRLTAKGYYLSFGAAILKNPRLGASLRAVPGARLFLETDDVEIPIEEVYLQAAQIRNQTLDSLILQLHENFRSIFHHL